MEESASPSAACPSFIKEFPDPILDNVLEYVLKNTTYCHEVEGITANAELQRWGFSEDIGKAVVIEISANRAKYIYREILDLTGICLFIDFSEPMLHSFDNKIHNYGYLLILGNQFECLRYLAVICEIILSLFTASGKYLIRRVINIAKVTLRRYAPTNYFYMDLDSTAKYVLAKHNQLVLDQNESDVLGQNESDVLDQNESDVLNQNESDDVFIPNESDVVFIPNESDDVFIPNESDDVFIQNKSDDVFIQNKSDNVFIKIKSDVLSENKSDEVFIQNKSDEVYIQNKSDDVFSGKN